MVVRLGMERWLFRFRPYTVLWFSTKKAILIGGPSECCMVEWCVKLWHRMGCMLCYDIKWYGTVQVLLIEELTFHFWCR